ncbi:uncharacterized protein LOC111006524 [Momordica charantia]|uniref:Uncharacterized protein LOC111006524 n=1 Tax=Momordica charantia TaxID=3673 RepID=A0A6J1C1B9_MOMCH|nr:uncharacterized protein LOC111006524 [Momordica charantia]XP_022134207.1 uncharacterized protein LOC111006524 [Momordica charantia]XP_022134208.1 uncharacterized protein LOC111006524 [Momordica charantia]XP_022134209.1 uncharacterized protein LOC111006524 [Momordica charantia]XP_022134210.1 uncharacterized protein LOC111006524 [Momordica charantia]
MAEKGDVLPVTPETIVAAGTNLRRSSMGGQTSSSNSGEKLVPHYLRASTGSCHDFCKYGRKHAFETKTRLPMLKNVASKSLDSESSVDSVVLPERKKTTSTKAHAKFSSASRLSDTDSTTFVRPEMLVKSSVFPSPIQREVLNESKKKLLAGPRPLPESGSQSPIVLRPMQKEVLNESKKKLLFEPRPLPKSRSRTPVFSSPMQREVLNASKKKLLAEPRPSLKSRSHTTNALKNLKPRASSATRNPEDAVVQVLEKSKERRLPEKHDDISKSKSIKVKPLRSAGSPENLRRKNDSEVGKSLVTSKEAAKRVAASARASLSSNSIRGAANFTVRKRSNLKAVPLKTRSKTKIAEREQVRSEEVQEKTFQSEEEIQEKTFQIEEVQEKTLYVIKIENEEKSPQYDQNETDDNMEAVPFSPPKSLSSPPTPSFLANEEDHDVSEYTESEAEDDSYSEDDELGSMEAHNVSSEGGKEVGSHNLGMYQSEGKDPQSTKLSFRRGKIIDIRSESNSPRRLKFRRGRQLGENQRAVDGFRKNFKKVKEVDSDTNTIETAPETVVLRHQDVQGKKDAQGLFNNVIEETASKLVETRKSKVKALVGAFETVISLQDGKPSLDTAS